MKIGEFIKKLRESKNWQQQELANKAQIERTKLLYIEKYRMPTFDVACKLCEALDITPNVLWAKIREDVLKIPSVEEKALENSGEDGRRLGGDIEEKST